MDSYLTQLTPSALQFLSKHIISTPDLALGLGTSTEEGLSAHQLRINQEIYGKNKYKID